MWDALNRWIAPLKKRVITMVVKAVITNVTDSGEIQLVQIDMGNGELVDSVERVQNFGFTSFPLVDSEAVVLCIAGSREHPVVVTADQGSKRPTLKEGESAMYNAHDLLIKLDENGIINIGDINTTLLQKDGVLSGNTINPVTGAPFSAIPTDVSAYVRVRHL